MSATVPIALPASRSWIVAPWWDLSYILLTPLAIVPIVWLLGRWGATPEQLGLGAIAFASLGHHFPGFLRAYGERDLFSRYRVRLIAAPLAFAFGALLFSPPPLLAGALGLSWRHLHGLELILLFWGTWHGLMQTYGFMRIYDLRRGETGLLDARLDYALCLTLFIGGVIMSESRMFSIANAMWQAGLPYFDRSALNVVRWLTGAALGLTLAGYCARQVQRSRQGLPLNWQKLVLASVTGAFFWQCGSLSTNVLIGVAMFEIYHALQYDAIVWIYDRRLLARAGDRLGLLGWLFRDRWSMLALYLALIAAYSSLRLLAGDATGYLFAGPGGDDLQQALLALYVTSSFMHFYFDGFIWKVSQPRAQVPFVDRADAEPQTGRKVDEYATLQRRHALQWSLLFVVALSLMVSEARTLASDADERAQARASALAALTPELPECQLLRGHEALQAGKTTEAAGLAWSAAQRRRSSAATLVDAGELLLDARDFARAVQLFDAAAAMAPGDARLVRNQGAALLGDGKRRAAIERLSKAVELDGASAEAHRLLGHAWLHEGEPGKSVSCFRSAVRLDPKSGNAYLELGTAYYALEKWPLAAEAFQRAAETLPDQAAVYVNLGSAQLQQGLLRDAEATYRRGLKLAPESRELRYNLGMLLAQIGNAEEAQQLLAPIGGDAGR